MNREEIGNKSSCRCDWCQDACRHKPGWFLPGEAEKVGEYLGLTLEELFQTKLLVDWWREDSRNFYLLSPTTKGNPAGKMFPFDPLGECIFFKDGECEIHSVKPFECAELFHDSEVVHKKVADAWNEEVHQEQIANLLGCEPEDALEEE